MENRKSSGICAVAIAAVIDSSVGFTKFAGGILHIGVGHLVLNRINQLDVTEGARRLLDLPATPSLPLPPSPTGQFTDVFVADLLFPFRADLAQVIGPDIGRAAAIRTMDDHDFLIGQA